MLCHCQKRTYCQEIICCNAEKISNTIRTMKVLPFKGSSLTHYLMFFICCHILILLFMILYMMSLIGRQYQGIFFDLVSAELTCFQSV